MPKIKCLHSHHWQGDIIRKAEYEVLEISVKPTSLQSLRDAVINAKCLIDVCPIYGNVAIAYHDSITIYRHVIAGVTNNLMDYELIMELVPLVSPLKCIEILGSYLAIGQLKTIYWFCKHCVTLSLTFHNGKGGFYDALCFDCLSSLCQRLCSENSWKFCICLYNVVNDCKKALQVFHMRKFQKVKGL